MLRQVGHNVTIVEANTRVGGRVKTFRNTAEKKYWEDDSLYAEAGAMRLPNFHYMVMEYCKQLNVTLEPFYYVSVDKAQALNNKEEGYRNNSDRYPKKTLNSYLFVNYKQVVQKDYYSEGADINALLDYHLQANKNRGQDGKRFTDDDIDLGPVKADWSLEEYHIRFDDDDLNYVGTLDQSGLFTPNVEGPNTTRRQNNNNTGDVWVVATHVSDGAARPIKGRAHLLVTVPVYTLWDFFPQTEP